MQSKGLAGRQGGKELLTTKLPRLKVLTAVNGLFLKDRADGDGVMFSPSLASRKPYPIPLLWHPHVARENGTTLLDRYPHHWAVLSPSFGISGLRPGFRFSDSPSKPPPKLLTALYSLPPH